LRSRHHAKRPAGWLTDGMDGDDDLLLRDIRHRHQPLRRHCIRPGKPHTISPVPLFIISPLLLSTCPSVRFPSLLIDIQRAVQFNCTGAFAGLGWRPVDLVPAHQERRMWRPMLRHRWSPLRPKNYENPSSAASTSRCPPPRWFAIGRGRTREATPEYRGAGCHLIIGRIDHYSHSRGSFPHTYLCGADI
jgi:hypothetical protein